MSTLLIKNIAYLVTCDDANPLLQNKNLMIADGRIVAIDREEHEADERIDASHMIVYPGLINAHHHLYQIFTRNLPQVQNMELFDWLKTLYKIWGHFGDEDIYYSTAVGLGELLKTGCTTCFDHHYIFPKGAGTNLIATQFDAADRLGIRMHVSRGSMSLGEKEGGLPPDSLVQSTEEILLDSERTVRRFHDPSRFSMHQVVLAPCSPFSVTPELMTETAGLARKLKVRMHTHLAETADETAFVEQKLGMRPLAYMEKLGFLGSDVWFAHGIHFNDSELNLLAETRTGVCHCPISNMKLASGVARVAEMLRRQIPVGLGVDGSASNDGSNMLEEIRAAYLLQRLTQSVKAPTGYDILKMATVGSAELLGRDDIGKLKVGMAADLFMVDTERLELTATLEDPLSMLATVGFKGSVDYTVVNGRTVVKEGHLASIDERRLAHKAGDVWGKLLNHSKADLPRRIYG